MNIEIINTSVRLEVYGFSGIAFNKDYTGTAFKLMDKMWQVVKSTGLQNKGLNIWVYEPGDKVFAGVELYEVPGNDTRLEYKSIELTKFAYYKHIGPYNLLKQVGRNVNEAIKAKGFEPGNPYIEIYGHWTNDETKLETELLVSLQ